MIKSLIIAIGTIVAIMMGWLAVQTMWKKVFSDYHPDEDAMSGRTECSNCGCTEACDVKRKQFSENIN